MTVCEPIGAACRDVPEIDALMRALLTASVPVPVATLANLLKRNIGTTIDKTARPAKMNLLPIDGDDRDVRE